MKNRHKILSFKKTVLSLLFLGFCLTSVFAQECICPIVKVTAPPAPVKAGEIVTFSAEVSGNKNYQTNYNWTVSAGTIIAGQGTPEIKIDTSGLEGGMIIIAAIDVSGNWCSVCDNLTVSETAVIQEDVKPFLLEKFSRYNCEYVLMQTDRFLVELSNNPVSTGYVIIYGKPRIAAAASREMKNWIKNRGFDVSRTVFIDGGGIGGRAEIEFWLVPPGAAPPEPSPQPESVEPDKTIASETEIRPPNKPYIFSSEYYDGVAGCGESEELNLEGFAALLKENPKSRGNIVIILDTKAGFREKEKEILDYLTAKGIARKRLRTFYVNSFGGVELWFLP
jgi:hypothetical protein